MTIILRLTQSRCETSSSGTDDDLDVCVLFEMSARWANKSLRYDGVCANTPVPQFSGLLQQRLSTVCRYTRRLQELLKGLVNILLLKMRWD